MPHKISGFLSKYQLYLIVSLNVILFALLLFKDPFSIRTLIPNLEPFPDTIHYINPALSFLEFGKLRIVRNGFSRTANVPPLYSIILIPLLFINKDARMFYYTNIILSFISFFLFYKILKRITKNTYVIGLCLFLYVSNYFLYWVPSLAMSENLVLPLFLGGIYLITCPVTPFNTILAGIIAISFYGAKYAGAPLTASYIFLYIFRIIFNKKDHRDFIRILTSAGSLILVALIFLGITNLLRTVYSSISLAFFKPFMTLFWTKERVRANFHNEPFSRYYFDRYFPLYLKAVLGNPARFLWDNTPIVPRLVGLSGLAGMTLGIFHKKLRFLSISLVLMFFFSLYFISNFYSFDMRYVYHAIPIMLIGTALFLAVLESISKRYRLSKIFYLGLIVWFSFYFLANATRFKKQIMLNIKYQETPWYYVGITELNKYFAKPRLSPNGKKPVVISVLMPYYIDFFSNGNYDLLPLSESQDFFNKENMLIWGDYNYSNLIALYTDFINKGYEVYVHNSGLGNVDRRNISFKNIQESFRLTKVVEGCFDSCNIYKVGLKGD